MGGTVPIVSPNESNRPKNKFPDKARLNRLVKTMYEKRRQYQDRWEAIRDYQLPFIGEFDETADKTHPARRRDLKIAQGVAWQACQIFAAGVMSGLTPPSRQWFRFTFQNGELNGNVNAMRVLDQRYEIVSHVLAQSNFYNSVHSVYLELPFGQCPMAVFSDPEHGVRFQTMTIGTYALGVNGFGKVDTFARKYDMTLRQLIDCFGVDALPDSLKNMAKNNVESDKKYKVNWVVEPNNDQLPGYDNNLNMPYRSIYWLENSSENEFLYIGGFEEWAIPTARYLVNGLEPYGKGPGWFAEGDSKMLQVMKKDYLTAVELGVKPPMKAPSNLMNNGGINLIPGGMTAVDDQSNQYVQPLFQVALNLKDAQQEIMRIEDSIKRAYSADLFLMLDNVQNDRMTAREVVERTQEKLQQLGPVVERLQDEFLSVIIQRVYSILDRAGAFPPVPDELIDVIGSEDINVDYISPLAQAQKMSGLINIEQGLSIVAQMAQMWPEVLKKIDPMNTIKKYFELVGAPAVMQRSDEEVAQMIQAEQEQMQQDKQLQESLAVAQATAPIAEAAKNMTEAANDGNPALASWIGAPGGYE